MLFVETVIELTQYTLFTAFQLSHPHATDQPKHIFQAKLQSFFNAELINSLSQDSSKVLAFSLHHLPLSLPVQPDSHLSIFTEEGLEDTLDNPMVYRKQDVNCLINRLISCRLSQPALFQ